MDRNDKSCPHKLPNLHVLHKLLQLLPHFNDMVASLTTGKEPTTMPIHLAEPGTRPLLMDSSNPVVKLVIKGRDVHGCIIDGDLCVNVISEATCHDHGITQWEPCLFWLRVADTHPARPMGLICHLDFILRGHTFTILAVVLCFDALVHGCAQPTLSSNCSGI